MLLLKHLLTHHPRTTLRTPSDSCRKFSPARVLGLPAKLALARIFLCLHQLPSPGMRALHVSSPPRFLFGRRLLASFLLLHPSPGMRALHVITTAVWSLASCFFSAPAPTRPDHTPTLEHPRSCKSTHCTPSRQATSLELPPRICGRVRLSNMQREGVAVANPMTLARHVRLCLELGRVCF
jgi:hypothetical protein